MLNLYAADIDFFDVEEEQSLLKEMGLDISFALDMMKADEERRRAEEKIHSLARFPYENPNPVLRLDADGAILYANPASGKLLLDWGYQVGGWAPLFWRQQVSEALAAQKSATIDAVCGDVTYSFFVAPIVEAGYVNCTGAISPSARRRKKNCRHRRSA